MREERRDEEGGGGAGDNERTRSGRGGEEEARGGGDGAYHCCSSRLSTGRGSLVSGRRRAGAMEHTHSRCVSGDRRAVPGRACSGICPWLGGGGDRGVRRGGRGQGARTRTGTRRRQVAVGILRARRKPIAGPRSGEAVTAIRAPPWRQAACSWWRRRVHKYR